MKNNIKKLYLLRHGEADNISADYQDSLRKLTPEGKKQVLQMANYLQENQIKIDVVISSQAVRSEETAQIIRKQLNLHEVEFEDCLYPCTSSCIYNTIVSVEDSINSILIIGHNPGLTSFAQEYMQLGTMHLGTSGMISCSFETNSWAEFALSNAKRNFVTSPK